MDTCLREKGKANVVKKVHGGRTHWLAGHMAWPPGHDLVSYHLGQVSGAPPQLYKYPPMVEMRRHTPHFGYSTCKALIPTVVARCRIVGRVARL
jgi:hypothetical protein